MLTKKTRYITQLIKQGEGLHLDFKFEVSDSVKIARSLVAFANTGGGTLLIGVNDNGSIQGIRSEEEFYMIRNAARNFCRPVVEFNIVEWNIKGKKILEVTIPKSNSIPHKAPGKTGKYLAFIRIVDENIVAGGVQIKVWRKQNSKKSIRFNNTQAERILLEHLKEHSKITVWSYRKVAGLPRFRAEDTIANFIILGLARMETTAESCFFTAEDIPEL